MGYSILRNEKGTNNPLYKKAQNHSFEERMVDCRLVIPKGDAVDDFRLEERSRRAE